MVKIKTNDIKLYQKIYYLNNREKILLNARHKREGKTTSKRFNYEEIEDLKTKKFNITQGQVIVKFD